MHPRLCMGPIYIQLNRTYISLAILPNIIFTTCATLARSFPSSPKSDRLIVSVDLAIKVLTSAAKWVVAVLAKFGESKMADGVKSA